MLYIMGGVRNRDIFDKNSQVYEEELYLLDLNNLTWTPIRMLGTIHRNLFDCEWLLLGKFGVMVFSEEGSIQVKRFDMT